MQSSINAFEQVKCGGLEPFYREGDKIRPGDADQHGARPSGIAQPEPRRRNTRSLDDGRQPLGPVMAAARIDLHLLALTDSQEAEAVVLDLVGPLRPGGDRTADRWKARFDEARHEAEVLNYFSFSQISVTTLMFPSLANEAGRVT
jgi:hypothetical protein